MAIFGTTEESKFAVYLFFRIEEIADRVIERMLNEKIKILDLNDKLNEIEDDEIAKVATQYLIENNKIETGQVEQAYQIMIEKAPKNTAPRPTLGVVKKDGTIEPVPVNERSPELKTVVFLIMRIVRDGYALKSASQLIGSREKTAPKPRKMPFENLFYEVPGKTNKTGKGAKSPKIIEMRDLSETELETLANKARKFVERQKAKRKKPTR